MADDRRCCVHCLNLREEDRDGFRRCRAAARGELSGKPWAYTPVPTVRRRCEAYSPAPGDPDQRPGRVRWPGLLEATQDARH